MTRYWKPEIYEAESCRVVLEAQGVVVFVDDRPAFTLNPSSQIQAKEWGHIFAQVSRHLNRIGNRSRL